MRFFLRFILQKIIFIAFSFSVYSSDNTFIREVERRKLSNNNLFYIDFLGLSNTAYSSSIFGVEINPFFQFHSLINNLSIRFNYNFFSSNNINSHTNNELLFSYKLITLHPLTLYVSYAMYSMHELSFFDFNLEKDIKETIYGRSYSLGMSINVYDNWYILAEKRWNKLDSSLVKNTTNLYLGLKFRLPIEIFKEN